MREREKVREGGREGGREREREKEKERERERCTCKMYTCKGTISDTPSM